MLQLLEKGGYIMWPLLVLSVLTLTIILERLSFWIKTNLTRDPIKIKAVLSFSNYDSKQINEFAFSKDFVLRVLAAGLANKSKLSFCTQAMQKQASIELAKFSAGLAFLDTTITLSPLLGLLGTVTGMIRSFGLLGVQELGAPTEITGGIAEALIATAFGLSIAICALLPFNFMQGQLEKARREIEQAGSDLEILVAEANS